MKAFYAGSFDPFTIGHLSIVVRALEIFDELIIGVGFNPSKRSEREVEERILLIQKCFKGISRVKVFGYDGLTAEVAKEHGAGVLVRGVRNTIDFEKEKDLANINLKVFGMPTVLLVAEPEISMISSSMVRELSHFGVDVRQFLAQDLE